MSCSGAGPHDPKRSSSAHRLFEPLFDLALDAKAELASRRAVVRNGAVNGEVSALEDDTLHTSVAIWNTEDVEGTSMTEINNQT